MTPREHSKALRAVRQAWEDGKEIEFNNKHDESGWLLYKGEAPDWYNKAIEWRVKAEPKLRPWRTEEVPVGALYRNKNSKNRSLIVAGIDHHRFPIRVIGQLKDTEIAGDRLDTAFANREWKWPHEPETAWRPCGVEVAT
jgi:hypothetical protein